MTECKIRLSEVPLHLYQILAGFKLLEQSGRLRLMVETLRPDDRDHLPYNMLEVIADGRRLIYDMNDGYDNLPGCENGYAALYNGLLARCDFLFKRSFSQELNAVLDHPEKIKRTAPNYLVTVRGNPAHRPVPCDPKAEKLKKYARMVPCTEYYNGHVLCEKLEAEPSPNREPRVLFMARLWDPAGDFSGQLNAEKSEERFKINETRAACIRACRREFGERFFGGVKAADFALREYPDIVIGDRDTVKKNQYLKYVKTFDINIATAGLHRSTGWKFAEYIAASRAIVSEPLYYESAGGLADGQHYLSFRDENECLTKISELFDFDARYAMMRKNRDYYQKFLRCDVLVENTLRTCLASSREQNFE
ncbi:MAG: hypothetical protein FWF05_00340 [Oscillospiraceae bacterium]|nr:hypothetical protein [Oscillospiraceae bacterium]